MKLGISTNSFFNRINTESSFDIVRQMYIDICEVYLTTFSEYEPKFLEALMQKKGNVYVHSVHPEGSQFEPELFSTNGRVRTDAENTFKKICYATRLLGAKHYIFHGPVRLKKTNYDFDFMRLGDRVNQLCEIARSFGIRLAYENVFYGYGNSPEYFKNLLRYCPNLACALNVKHALLSDTDPIKYLDVMEGRIVTIHLCDLKKDDSSALPGEGRYGFDKFFTELNRRNISTALILEVSGRDYKDIGHLKNCLDYLNAMMVRSR